MDVARETWLLPESLSTTHCPVSPGSKCQIRYQGQGNRALGIGHGCGQQRARCPPQTIQEGLLWHHRIETRKAGLGAKAGTHLCSSISCGLQRGQRTAWEIPQHGASLLVGSQNGVLVSNLRGCSEPWILSRRRTCFRAGDATGAGSCHPWALNKPQEGGRLRGEREEYAASSRDLLNINTALMGGP